MKHPGAVIRLKHSGRFARFDRQGLLSRWVA